MKCKAACLEDNEVLCAVWQRPELASKESEVLILDSSCHYISPTPTSAPQRGEKEADCDSVPWMTA
jgi:hypothetical protein